MKENEMQLGSSRRGQIGVLSDHQNLKGLPHLCTSAHTLTLKHPAEQITMQQAINLLVSTAHHAKIPFCLCVLLCSKLWQCMNCTRFSHLLTYFNQMKQVNVFQGKVV
jgi:hypothetical protein